jgi:hypothetical protein
MPTYRINECRICEDLSVGDSLYEHAVEDKCIKALKRLHDIGRLTGNEVIEILERKNT